MHFLYNIGILLLGVGIRVYALFNAKTRMWVEGRKNWYDQLPKPTSRKVVWFHCASLGEFDQGLPLMHKYREEEPDTYILVTFFSPSGMQHYHKRQHPADHVCYLPLDTPSNARKFINHFKPSVAFFVKYEFWSNFILSVKSKNCRIYNVSGIFRPDHRFFKSFGGFFRFTLRQFDWFFVQNQESVDLLKGIGIENASITGDSRFDKVWQTRENLVKNKKIADFCGSDPVFIIGSSWPRDEEIVIPVINKIPSKVIIAPHNIDDRHIKGITSKLERSYARFSKTDSFSGEEVLILDTIGHLSSAYAFGCAAYVGGGFSGNLHNILEPAVFGMGVLFGPKHDRFPEADEFITHGFGFDVSTSGELQHRLDYILENEETINQKASDFVKQNVGASDRIYRHVISSSKS